VLIEPLTDHSVFMILDNPDVQPFPYGSSRFVGQGYVEDGEGVLSFDFIEERPLESPPSFSYFVNAGSFGLALNTEKLEGHLYGQIGYTDPSVSASCIGTHDFLLSR